MNSISSMIEAALARPAMYTIHGTYEEVVAFLQGYYSGAAVGRPLEPSVSVWADFTEFLSGRLNAPTSQIYDELQVRYGSDAIYELKKLYVEFKTSAL